VLPDVVIPRGPVIVVSLGVPPVMTPKLESADAPVVVPAEVLKTRTRLLRKSVTTIKGVVPLMNAMSNGLLNLSNCPVGPEVVSVKLVCPRTIVALGFVAVQS
jgi:hypothetical protein